MPMKTQIGFSIYRNGKLIREERFDRPIINIGKLSTSNLRVDDINVSRKHAVIEQRENGQWRVTDLGSTNGTIIHGERVVQGDIHDGDRIVLGTTTLLVHLDEAAAQPNVVSGTTGGPATVGANAIAADASESADLGKTAVRPALTRPAPTGPAQEIRGLGADSFYKKKGGQEQDDELDTLEVALLWGETVLAVERFDGPQPIMVGERAGCRFAIPKDVLGTSHYELVGVSGGKHTLNLANEGIVGDVLVDGQVKSLEELREASSNKQFVIDRPARARLKVGDFTLLVTYGPTPKRGSVAVMGDVEVDPWIYIVVSAALHIGFLILLMYQVPGGGWTERDPHEARQRAIEALAVQPQDEEEEEEPEPEEEEDPDKIKYDKDADSEKKVTFQDTMQVEEVKPTKPTLQDPLLQQKKARDDFEKLSDADKREKAKELVNQTALAEEMRKNNPLLTDLLSTNPDLTNKDTAFQQIGSQDPNAPSDAYVTGSVDPFGGTLSPASGGFLTSGDVSRGDPRNGPAVAGLDGPGRDRRGGLNDLDFNERPADPKIIQMKPRLVGELDAATVQAYIRRYLSGIEWCYKERLQLKRQLAGKLTLAFTILPNGNVSGARTENSNLNDGDLEGCIVTKMRRWRFPQPKDGGLVEVAYPLILKNR